MRDLIRAYSLIRLFVGFRQSQIGSEVISRSHRDSTSFLKGSRAARFAHAGLAFVREGGLEFVRGEKDAKTASTLALPYIP